MLTTAVIGAGPAGMLFALLGKIEMGDDFAVELFDKREHYVRTHRLRLAPEPYLAIQAKVHDARFDSLVAFFREHHFSPEVNLLEAKLAELLAEVGVHKTVREVTSLDDLGVDTIVAADSVHSTIRELVRGSIEPARHTHERLARLRVTGADLPKKLGVLDQYRLAKVLGSVVDYRLNHNGFAEVDLFLTPKEHAIARALGATPRDPVNITGRSLSKVDAPFFRAVVEHLERGGREVVVQSTFELEHTVMPRVSFFHGDKRVFLLGDAAVSLPFFRGMACLAACAHSLAHAHATKRFDDYEGEVREIVAREMAIVRSRAQVIRGARELVRLSSMLPFPMQSWWLSAAKDPEPEQTSPSTYFNAAIAAVALGLVVMGLAVRWLPLASLPIEIGGGFAYRWTLALEPGPHHGTRRVWEVQIAVVLVLGVTLAVLGEVSPLAAGWWFVLGVAFTIGIYAFEGLVASRLVRARLDGDP